MTYTAEISEFKELWGLLFPGVPIPDDSQWGLWLIRHHSTVVRQGIAELGVKYRRLNGRMDPVWMGKFASSVMNRLTREIYGSHGIEREKINGR